MIPFLKQVADHYHAQGDISRRCFIFPNRRSMVFFRKWLCEAVAEAGRNGDVMPVVAPMMLTINDFFYKVSGLQQADRIKQLLELHACYKKLYPKAESLDEFIFWGDVILADFNDVDKYLADPGQLFANVSDFKAIQDSFSYLSDVQRKAIESFILHFSDGKGKLTVDPASDNPDVKERFLQIWNILYPLYRSFNEVLESEGLSYDGMACRSLAQKLSDSPVEDILEGRFPSDTSFVFVGLNALNACEKTLLRRLRDCGRAEFCWDWSKGMMQDRNNRSSFFMKDNLKDFPQAFPLVQESLPETSFNVLSVPSSYGQVKHLKSVLEKVGYRNDAYQDCSDTAVVLPDESLLMPLLNSVPEEVHDINVTMGYPLVASEMYVLMRDIARMQLHLRRKGTGWHFYHKHVWDILSSGMFRKLSDAPGMEGAKERIAAVRQEGKYYIPHQDLSGSPLLDLIFRPVVMDLSSSDAAMTDALASYLQEVAANIAPLLSEDPDMAVEMEFAKEYYSSLNSLRSWKLAVQPATFIRLVESMLSGVTIPFKGEPLKGLQVMGPLETRALDFRNVVILSCNEGMFPRRNVSSSFIPPELRKAFGLPTYEYQDAIWAYYFYRLVSRAENVWMVYDSRTEGLKRGEESRYIKQLKYHFGVDVKYHVAGAGMAMDASSESGCAKTDEMMKVISGMTFSASALQNYVLCPMKFCYTSVLKLKKDEDVAESLDNAMIGNVYHNAMWALYYGEEAMSSDGPFEKLREHPEVGQKAVTRKYLESWLEREEVIREKVDSLIRAELNSDEVTGRDLVVSRVIVRYVMETVRKDMALLDRSGADAFEILGLEKKVSADIHGARFFGVIDRMDSLAPGMIRVVDYKSGSDAPGVIAVSDGAADAAVAKIFDSQYKTRKDNKAALQFYIYDRMVMETERAGKEMIFNSLYSTSDLFRNTPSVYPLCGRFDELMDVRLKEILDEIRNKDIPFVRTEEEDACTYCDFKMICGR